MMRSERYWRSTELLVGILGVFAVSVSLLAGLGERGRGLDDAYITYRYAQNVASGHGFVGLAWEFHLVSAASSSG